MSDAYAWEDPQIARRAIPNPICSECKQGGVWTRGSNGLLNSGVSHLSTCWVLTGVRKNAPVQVVHDPRVDALRDQLRNGDGS